MESAVGRAAIRDSTGGFLAPLDNIHFEIHHQVAAGNLVMHERTATFRVGERATPRRVASWESSKSRTASSPHDATTSIWPKAPGPWAFRGVQASGAGPRSIRLAL
ncbi:nuclear transport factor 2 family protein [Streptomyces chartreusis]|uniref:nuclear transport factor 2 family protein n=1 Tax=Streptomyces chartreusis TaxID=1969 RepID=UPI0034E41573